MKCRECAAFYHADVVVHEPPAVNFTAIGLQNVLPQGDGKIVVKQPNVPQQICKTKRKTSYDTNYRRGRATKTPTEVQFRGAIHENERPQNEYNGGPEDAMSAKGTKTGNLRKFYTCHGTWGTPTWAFASPSTRTRPRW
jgi:hypothetical protein